MYLRISSTIQKCSFNNLFVQITVGCVNVTVKSKEPFSALTSLVLELSLKLQVSSNRNGKTRILLPEKVKIVGVEM